MLFQGFVQLIGMVCVGGVVCLVFFVFAVSVMHLFAGPVDFE